MPENGLARIFEGERIDEPGRLSDVEVAGMGTCFRRKIAWLGPYADPREYAVALGLRVTRQPLVGSREGAELVGDVIIYRGDECTRIWGARVYTGIAKAFLRSVTNGHTLTDRLRVVGEMAMAEAIAGNATLEDVLEAQIYCPAWLMRENAELIRAARRWPKVAVA